MRLSQRDLNRLRGVVKKTEQTPRSIDRRIPPNVPLQGFFAKTTGVIGAASGSTLGNGPATLQILAYDGTNASYSPFPGTSGNVTVFSPYSSPINSGTTVYVVPCAGVWIVDIIYC